MRRCLVLLVGLLFIIGACGDDDTTGSGELSTTVSVATTTTELMSTTKATTTSSVAAIVLATDGLGVVSFGASAEGAIALLSDILGLPTQDTGYETDTPCSGAHRSVTWQIEAPGAGGVATALALHFTDDGRSASEFTDYSYWRSFPSEAPRDARGLLETPEGITVGSSVTEVRAAYPGIEFVFLAFDSEVVGSTPSDLILYPVYTETVDLDTDLATLEGWLFGMRYRMEGCPDELS